ncbi:MAG: hypothetical protein IKU70_12140 [Clostridia bacterium]|nr:hypothetical protein [Clostridia bacterium]
MTKKTRAKMRRALFTMSLVLVMMMVAVGGTIAWLTDTTDSLENVFTTTEIDIDLTETTGTSYAIVPGVDITKDPKVTVNADSEAAWVFVKVEEVNFPEGEIMTYEIADGWALVDGETNVYYRAVAKNETDNQDFYVIKGNVIVVSDEITNADMDEITTPKLIVTAYAIQQAQFETAEDAWAEAETGAVKYVKP